MTEYTPEQARKIRAVIDGALKTARAGSRRHPAEVTSDRLGDAVMRWGDRFEPGELDMVAVIRQRLEEIAQEDGSRSVSPEGKARG